MSVRLRVEDENKHRKLLIKQKELYACIPGYFVPVILHVFSSHQNKQWIIRVSCFKL